MTNPHCDLFAPSACDRIPFAVMAGLDPAIQATPSTKKRIP
jgi:hypothetical protein